MPNEVTPEQVQKFVERSREFEKQHGVNLDSVLRSAAARGLNLPNTAARVLIQECSPEAAYDLAREENDAFVRSNFNVSEGEPQSEQRTADRIRRHISQVRRNETYKTIEAQESSTDKYLRQRREDIRSGKRRR
jgi:hypothetical protein